MTDLKFPPFKWAQNAERVLMTINITDCENIEVDVSEEENKVKFSATSNGVKYGLDMEVFMDIVKESSAWNTKGRNVIINLAKKEKSDEDTWWPRITKEKVKNGLIEIDWSRWVDPDGEDEKPESQDFDPSQMQGMGQGGPGGPGGMGGMPGMGGMGGMPGMGGPGGPGGMDMASMMAGMGGGAGGAGGMDMASMMAGMGGGAGGAGGPGGMDMASLMA